jgi:hypothetical protein
MKVQTIDVQRLEKPLTSVPSALEDFETVVKQDMGGVTRPAKKPPVTRPAKKPPVTRPAPKAKGKK